MRDYLQYEKCVPIKHIQEHICRKYDLTIEQITGDQRSRRIAWARQEAFYLAQKYSRASLPVIGKEFGDRHHTTVMYGIKKHEQRMGQGA